MAYSCANCVLMKMSMKWKVNRGWIFDGMENGGIHEQAGNEDEKENGYSGYEWMKCEGIGVSHMMKTWMGLLFVLLVAGEDEDVGEQKHIWKMQGL